MYVFLELEVDQLEKQYIIEFSSQWILDKRNEDIMPVDVIVKWAEGNNLKLMTKNFTEIVLVGEPLPCKTDDELKDSLVNVLKDYYGEKTGDVEHSITCMIKDHESDNEDTASTGNTEGNDTDNSKAAAGMNSGKDIFINRKAAGKDSGKGISDTGKAVGNSSSKSDSDAAKTTSKNADINAGKDAAGNNAATGDDDSNASGKTAENAEENQELLDRLDSLVGADEFVNMCKEMLSIAPVLRDHDALDALRNQVYLFSIDDGDGLTTGIKLLQEVLLIGQIHELKGNPGEFTFHKTITPTANPEEEIRDFSVARNKLLCIDLSEWIGEYSDPMFKRFMRLLHRNLNNAAYVFRIPYLQEDVMAEAVAAIGDVFRVNRVSFTPIDEKATREIAENKIKEKGFTVENDVWELFEKRIIEEKSDGKYYGFKTIENVVDDMLLYKARSIVLKKSDDSVIHRDELTGLTRDNKKEKTAAEEFDSLSGMEDVKKKILEIADQMAFVRNSGDDVNMPAMHMRFVGAPGTGKTTMARIVGKLFHERGLLSKGYFLEYTGGDFMGSYVGQTAPLVKQICQGAYGSVLFIDEAYTLTGYSQRSFSQEAIESLLAQMENNRKDLVVIMAGYEEDMEKLMDTNPGLKDRMPNIIKFENYSRETLFDIFKKLLEGSPFKAGEGLLDEVGSYFKNLDQAVLDDPTFSNGRYVRNLFEKTWGKTISRNVGNKAQDNIIIPEDFKLVVEYQQDELNRKRKIPGHSGIKLGFVAN